MTVDRQERQERRAEDVREPDIQTDELAHRVIGAALEVHRALGPGYLESIYEEALAHELRQQEVSFARQYPVAVYYKDKEVGLHRIDLLVADSLVVEIKTVDRLGPVHMAQVISYLKATGLHLGLLINFNTSELRRGIKRVVRS